MQLDWTTFALEVINFLALVWILKRLFYQPVLNALDARQARVRAETAQAAKLQQEADSLRQQYEERLAHWAQEREEMRRKLEQELVQQRAAGMERIRRALGDEEEKARVRDAARTAAHEFELTRQAAGAAYRDVASMLHRLASPALTESIARLLIEDLAELPQTQREALRGAVEKLGADATAEIAPAHPLDDATVQDIARGLTAAAGRALRVTLAPDPALIAGVRIAVGECLLHANLADELAFFRRQDGNP